MKKLIIILLFLTSCGNKRNVLFRAKFLQYNIPSNEVYLIKVDSAYVAGDTIYEGWSDKYVLLQRVK